MQLARIPAQIWEKPETLARYLLSNEPTAGLEISYQHLTLETARRFAEKDTAVLVVLHDSNLAAQYADKIMILPRSGKFAFDTPPKVLTSDLIREFFEIEAHIARHAETHEMPVIVPVGRTAPGF